MGFKSAAQRAKLAPRKAPYWIPLDSISGRLGFRKSSHFVGFWLVKWQASGCRQQQAIGKAESAQGDGGLSFAEARRRAEEIIACGLAASTHGPTGSTHMQTVADAAREYVRFLTRNRKASTARDAAYRSEKFIERDPIGRVKLPALTKKQVENWQDRLLPTHEEDPEKIRKAKDTANRILTILKACLNRALQDGFVTTDSAWRTVKPFSAVARARTEYLQPNQIQNLLEAADQVDPSGDSRRLFAALVLTGARPGELSEASRKDFDRPARTILLDGKTGLRTTYLSLTACNLFDECLASAQNKTPDAPLLQRNGQAWQKQHWARMLAKALQFANLPSMPLYALRHSHASAALNAGVPMKILAANLGTSVKMLESNYQKFGDHERKQASERIQLALDGVL